MDQQPKLRPGRPRPTMAFRVNAGLYDQIKTGAAGRELSITEEIERRLVASFDAETLEALLRRVVREQVIGAMRDIIGAADANDLTGLTGATFEVAMEDALALMADAQH